MPRSAKSGITRLQVECIVQKAMDARIDPTVRLTITDQLSGLPLAEVKLTSGQFLSMVTGSVHTTDDGWIQPRLERIGKRMVWREVKVPKEITEGIPYRGDGQKDAARAWGKTQAQPGEDVEPRNTNSGWVVVFRSYVAEEV